MILAHELIKWRELPPNLKRFEQPKDFNKLAMLANVELNDKELLLWITMFRALMNQYTVDRHDYSDFQHLFGRKCDADRHKDMCYDSDCMWDYKSKVTVSDS